MPNEGIDCIALPNRRWVKSVMEDVVAVVPHIPSYLHQLSKPGDGPPLRGAAGANGGQVM